MKSVMLLVFVLACSSFSANAGDFYLACGKVTSIATSGERVGISMDSPEYKHIGVDVWINGGDDFNPKTTTESLAATQRILSQAQFAMGQGLTLCVGSEEKPLETAPGLGLFQMRVRKFDSTSVSVRK